MYFEFSILNNFHDSNNDFIAIGEKIIIIPIKIIFSLSISILKTPKVIHKKAI